MAEYKRAPEVERVAEKVMREHHRTLYNRGPNIEYVMTKPSRPSQSVPNWKMRKVGGIHAYLCLGRKPHEFGQGAEAFLVLEVSTKWWESLQGERREAFLDHVLEHLHYDLEKGTWTIEGPDYGEFPNVIKRRGFWRPDNSLRRFARTMSEQLSLLDLEADRGGVQEDAEADGEQEEEEGEASGENLAVSIRFGDRSVETDTDTMSGIADGRLLRYEATS